MKTFKAARRTGSSLTVELEGGKEIFFARDVRGALTWPNATTPLYYCIFCQKEQLNEFGKAPLVLLCEESEDLPTKLFKKLLNNARDY